MPGGGTRAPEPCRHAWGAVSSKSLQPEGGLTLTEESASSTRETRQTFSAFVAKILDQLSLSSWFPAAVLMGGGVLLLQLHSGYSQPPLKRQGLAGAFVAIEHYP